MPRHSSQLCEKYQAALDLVAKRWTGQLVTALREGPLRFAALRERLEVVGDRMLSERLRELEGNGIVERRLLLPLGVEYALTKKGKALVKVFAAVEKWADGWLDDARRRAL